MTVGTDHVRARYRHGVVEVRFGRDTGHQRGVDIPVESDEP
jgi:hypothetical protein